jgi:hypothetical protein
MKCELKETKLKLNLHQRRFPLFNHRRYKNPAMRELYNQEHVTAHVVFCDYT